MGELRASVDGCELVVHLEEGSELSGELRDALSEVADAMYAERAEAAEVSGFTLKLGDMGLGLGPKGPVTTQAWSCWGFDASTMHCTWFSEDAGCAGHADPPSCTVYTRKKG